MRRTILVLSMMPLYAGCKPPASATFSGSATLTTMTDKQLDAALAQPQVKSNWKQFVQMASVLKVKDYQQILFANATNEDISVDGVHISHVKDALNSHKESLDALAASGLTMGSLWKAARITFKMPNLAQYKAGLLAVKAWTEEPVAARGRLQGTTRAAAPSAHRPTVSMPTAQPAVSDAALALAGLSGDGGCTDQHLSDQGKNNQCGDDQAFIGCFAAVALENTLSNVATAGKAVKVTEESAKTVMRVADHSGTAVNLGAGAGGCSDTTIEQRLTCLYGNTDGVAAVFDCELDDQAKNNQNQNLSWALD